MFDVTEDVIDYLKGETRNEEEFQKIWAELVKWKADRDEEMKKAARILSDNHILDYNRVISWWNAEKGRVKRGYRLPWRIVCAAHWFEVFGVKVRQEG